MLFSLGFGLGLVAHWAFNKYALPKIKEKIANWVK